MRPSILICRRVFPETVARLREHFDVESNDADDVWTREEMIARLHGKAGVFVTGTQPIDAALLDACPGLRAVCSLAVGYNNIDVEVLAQVRHRLREDTTADQDRGSHGAVRAINTAVSQSRKRTKPATGSRSVTSVFSIAAGSAQPSDMPQTSCSFAGAPISSVTMR